MIKKKTITTIGICIFLVSVGILFPNSKKISDSSNLDFSAMDQFWKITSILQNNLEPKEIDWEILFNTPGYATLTASEFSKEYFKNYFRLAYMPNRSKDLQKELSKPHYKSQYLNHMTKVISQKKKIKHHRALLTKSNTLTAEGLKLTQKYFIDQDLEAKGLPPIAFVVFGNDARGYSTIIIDILSSIEQGNKLKYLIGHEAHHFYRNQQLKFNFPHQNHPDYNIIWVLNQIQAEGIADQIDKRVRFFNGGDMEKSKWGIKYREYVKQTPELINKFNSLLVQYNSKSPDSSSLSKDLRKIIPMSGHPTGYFMTKAIIDTFGKKELLMNIGNPFYFFKLYNRAAKKHRGKYQIFSKKAMELIEKLKLKYLIK